MHICIQLMLYYHDMQEALQSLFPGTTRMRRVAATWKWEVCLLMGRQVTPWIVISILFITTIHVIEVMTVYTNAIYVSAGQQSSVVAAFHVGNEFH